MANHLSHRHSHAHRLTRHYTLRIGTPSALVQGGGEKLETALSKACAHQRESSARPVERGAPRRGVIYVLVHLEEALSTWCHVTYWPPSHVTHALAHGIMTPAFRLISVHVWRAVAVHTAALGPLFARKTTFVMRYGRQRRPPLRGGAGKNVTMVELHLSES